MGHYCSICGEYKANEKFSGSGHKEHICKECMSSFSKAERTKAKTIERLDYLPWRKLKQGQKAFLMEKLKDEDDDIRHAAEIAYDRVKHPDKYHILQKLENIPDTIGKRYMALLERSLKHQDEDIRTTAERMYAYIMSPEYDGENRYRPGEYDEFEEWQ